MVTVFVLCGVIGHFIGSANAPARDARAILYPAPRSRSAKGSTSNQLAVKLANITPRGKN